MMPNSCNVPTTKPTIPASVRTPQRAVSEAVHPVVLVPLTVEIKTLANIIAPIDIFTIPPMKLAMVLAYAFHPLFCYNNKMIYKSYYRMLYILQHNKIFIVNIKLCYYINKMSRIKVLQTFTVSKETLEAIKEEVDKIGHGASLSGWISQACEDKIRNKNKGVELVLKKLKSWYNSFPREPLTKLIQDIEEEYNGKIQQDYTRL